MELQFSKRIVFVLFLMFDHSTIITIFSTNSLTSSTLPPFGKIESSVNGADFALVKILYSPKFSGVISNCKIGFLLMTSYAKNFNFEGKIFDSNTT